jgi:predicted small lipoprotein YifL
MKKLFSLLLIAVIAFSLAACGEDIAYLPVDEFQTQIDGKLNEALEDYLPADDYVEYSPALEAVLTDAADGLTLTTNPVVSNLTLPAMIGDVQVIWQSSDPSIINSNGVVNQPSFLMGEKTVTLTAFLIANGQVTSKSFMLTVPALAESDAEKVAQATADVAALLEADVYTESVNLPTVMYGANIEWQSSNPMYFSAEGNVARPHFDQTDEEVVLTAYIMAGANLQLYKKTVTVAKMEFKQYGLLSSGAFNAANLNATEGAPLTFKIVTEEGHELYIPYSNVNAEKMYVTSPYPHVYTPVFGETVPNLFVNGLGAEVASDWGVAMTVVDGVVDTIYDGIGKKIFNADNPDGIALAAGTTYTSNIEIPENGFAIVFHNSGASIGNTLSGREFGRSVIGVGTASLGKTIDLVGLELDAVGVQLSGGVFWRGFVDVTVPFENINPAPWHMFVNYSVDGTTTSNFAFFQGLSTTSDEGAPLADGTNVTGAAPLLFNQAYFDAFGGSAVNTGQGYTLAAVMQPESETTQIIQIQEEDRELILTNEYELYRVYDGIGGSIKTKGAASVTLAGGDSGKAMAYDSDSFLIFYANNGVSYAQDTHNRRIAADYFYAVENWIWGFETVNADDMLPTGYSKYLFADILDQFEFVEAE